MPDVPAEPFLLHDVSLSIGGNTYEAACRTVRFVPTTPKVVWKGLAKNTRTFVGTPSWVANVTFAQDMASAASLTKHLLDTAPGTVEEVVFEPTKGAGGRITASIVIEPADLGGDIDTVPEASVAFSVDGQPDLAPIAP